ncbi:MAG: CRP/FNR family cyclic AMP-dependent transcriptional regulator [Porticoccus sp.]|jgi:CRP/FNR family cyclic AMP-dependent transcriptional regulator
MTNSSLADDDFVPIMDSFYARDHKQGESELAAAPITPHITNVEELLIDCHRRKYPAKITIIYAGYQGDTLSSIIKGSAKVLLEDDNGRDMIVGYLNEGAFFGEMGLFE